MPVLVWAALVDPMSLLLRDVAAGRVMRGAEGRRVGVKFLLWENGGGAEEGFEKPFCQFERVSKWH